MNSTAQSILNIHELERRDNTANTRQQSKIVEWRREWNIGIDVIDSQHQRILDYVNRLAQMENDQNHERVREVIGDLIDYTVSHFSFEEDLLEQVGYPFLKAHKKIHTLFIRKIRSIAEQFDQGEEVASELRNILQKWLIDHIQQEDGDYTNWLTPYLKKKNRGWMQRSIGRFFR